MGERERKEKWLAKLIDNEIIVLFEEGCACLKRFKLRHCNGQYYNNLNCALGNVYSLYFSYEHCKNKSLVIMDLLITFIFRVIFIAQ